MIRPSTHLHLPLRRGMRYLAGLFVLALFALTLSPDALAQNRVVLDRYDQLAFEVEKARKYDLNGSTLMTRQALERATQAFAEFERANAGALQQALATRARALGQAAASKGTDPIFTPQAVTTYTSTDVPKAISNSGTPSITSTLTIGDSGTINDLDVQVDITHTWVGDLKISLTSPNSTTVTLLNRPGVPASPFGCLDNDMSVLFDDESGGPNLETWCLGTTPWFTGDAPPFSALSAFDGEDIQGTWTLTVDDNAGGDGGSLDAWSLTIDFNEPPDCSGAAADPDELWPPNHQMEDIAITGVTDPDDDPVTITVDGITQDEPVNGLGDGDTAPDGAGVGTSTARVRAERQGPGNGRVYEISFTADDGQGGTCSGTVQVCVPHDQRSGGGCVDDGQSYDSTDGDGAAPRVAAGEALAVRLDAYPNPFNPATTITYTVAEAGRVQMVVYDVMGREVARLVDGAVEAGTHRVAFEARDLASGTYLVRLLTPQRSHTRPVVLMK